MDSKGYAILNPRELHRGKSYSDWTTDWFNWFLSANADKRNLGPVVFLRSHGLPHSNTSSRESLSDTSSDSQITDHPTIYVNDPNYRIASDGLQIFDDQSVFVPIIVAYQLGGSVSPNRDWGSMQDYVGLLIDNGDNPPDPMQLTITKVEVKEDGTYIFYNDGNPEPINLTIKKEKEDGTETEIKLGMEEFRITTPIFTAVVPEAPYRTSIKDFLEEGSIPAGSYPALVDGYFVMLKFTEPGSYMVHSWASAGREEKGPYFSELLYQIQVLKRAKSHGMITTMLPSRNEGLLNKTLNIKTEQGEMTDEQIKLPKSIHQNVIKKLKEKNSKE